MQALGRSNSKAPEHPESVLITAVTRWTPPATDRDQVGHRHQQWRLWVPTWSFRASPYIAFRRVSTSRLRNA